MAIAGVEKRHQILLSQMEIQIVGAEVSEIVGIGTVRVRLHSRIRRGGRGLATCRVGRLVGYPFFVGAGGRGLIGRGNETYAIKTDRTTT